jgi:hypothetical protein
MNWWNMIFKAKLVKQSRLSFFLFFQHWLQSPKSIGKLNQRKTPTLWRLMQQNKPVSTKFNPSQFERPTIEVEVISATADICAV